MYTKIIKLLIAGVIVSSCQEPDIQNLRATSADSSNKHQEQESQKEEKRISGAREVATSGKEEEATSRAKKETTSGARAVATSGEGEEATSREGESVTSKEVMYALRGSRHSRDYKENIIPLIKLEDFNKEGKVVLRELALDNPNIMDPEIIKFLNLRKCQNQSIEEYFSPMGGYYPSHFRLIAHGAPKKLFSSETERIDENFKNQPYRSKIVSIIAELKRERSIFRRSLRNNLYQCGFDGNMDQIREIRSAFSRDFIHSEVTHYAVREALKKSGLPIYFEVDFSSYETHIRMNNTEEIIYTLYGGMSAFIKSEQQQQRLSSSPLARDIWKKIGSPHKEYILDDFGVPTKRYVQAVKSVQQLKKLKTQNLTGRFYETHGTMLDITDEERAAMGFNTTGYETISKLKKHYPRLEKSPEQHRSIGAALYFHVENGSSTGQRGLSFSGSKYPILSNHGRGFGVFAKEGALRIVVDLARVPVSSNPQTEPALVNMYAIIGGYPLPVCVKDIVPGTRIDYVDKKNKLGAFSFFQFDQRNRPVLWTPEKSFKHYFATVTKNREIFVRSITPDVVTREYSLQAEDLIGGSRW